MAQQSITLTSPDGTKSVTIEIRNNGYLYYIGSDGKERKGTHVDGPGQQNP